MSGRKEEGNREKESEKKNAAEMGLGREVDWEKRVMLHTEYT